MKQGPIFIGGLDNFNNVGGNSSYSQFELGRISTKSIGRFRKILFEYDVAFIQTHTRQEA